MSHAAVPIQVVAVVCHVLEEGTADALVLKTESIWLDVVGKRIGLAHNHAGTPVFRPLKFRVFECLAKPHDRQCKKR